MFSSGESPDNSQAQVPLNQESLDDLVGALKPADTDSAEYDQFVSTGKLLLRELGVSPGEQVLLVNGRVCFNSFLVTIVHLILGSRSDRKRGVHCCRLQSIRKL